MTTPTPFTVPAHWRIAIVLITCIILLNNATAQTTQWTWLSGDNTVNQAAVYGTKGVAAAGNKPGYRWHSTGWSDAAGNGWVFGGASASNSQVMNDLWMYNKTTGWWTWVSGDNTLNTAGVYGTKGTPNAANKPGGRFGSGSWVDAAGNYWIFGGRGVDANGSLGYLSDLWKYDPTTGQ